MTAGGAGPLERALRRARAAALGSREAIGQESFVTATQVLSLAQHAGVRPGSRLLDLCCGTGGPGRFVTARLGCRYLGVDARPSAVAEARWRAAAEGLRCRIDVATVPPLPPGRFDVVLLVETLLAFPDREALLRAVAGALPPGARFALTVQAGRPLSAREARAMPESDTVRLTPLEELVAQLAQVGLRLRWQQEWTDTHRATVDSLLGAYTDTASRMRRGEDLQTLDRLLTSHRLWRSWLGSGRVRTFALVTERPRVSDRAGAGTDATRAAAAPW